METNANAEESLSKHTFPNQPLELANTNAGKRVSLSVGNQPSNAGILFNRKDLVFLDEIEFAIVSPYFRASFYGYFAESKKKIININHIEMMDFLFCCAFLKQIIVEKKSPATFTWISLEIAFKLLDIASYFLFDPILSVISNLIVERITAKNIVDAYHKAEHRDGRLAKKLWKIITHNFDRLYANKTYLRLNEKEIIKLLKEERLNICRWNEISMASEWIKENSKKGIQDDHLRSMLKDKNDSLGFMDIDTRIPNSILLASGGWSAFGPTTFVEVLDIRAQAWIRSEIKIFDSARAYHATINTGNDIITIGGFNGTDYYNSGSKFNLDTMECTEIAPMYERRCYVGCTLLNSDSVVAVGGYNNHDRLRTAEILFIPNNQWQRVAEMNIRRSDGHCVILNDLLYVIGGFDGILCHDTIEFYDHINNSWTTVSESMNARRSGVSAVAFERIIIVCGGFDGTSRLRSCEFYDPREGLWHRLKHMNRPRSNFGIEVLNNQVVVAGGYGGVVGTIAESEYFDFRANAWLKLPLMSLRRSALYLCRIDDHDIIKTFVR